MAEPAQGRPDRRATAERRPVSDLRRGGGLRRMPELLGQVLDPEARRRGLAEARILTDWPTIVGPQLAARCQPVRLSMGRRGDGGVLSVHVVGASALELQHSEPQVVERINGHFGRQAVARIRIVQMPPRAIHPPVPPRPPTVALDPAVVSAIAATVAPVADEDLRAALESLGRAVATHPVTPRSRSTPPAVDRFSGG